MSEPILFDTSVWINFFQKRNNSQTELLKHYLAEDKLICICPPIIQELLQGCKNKLQFDQLDFDLRQLILLDCGHYRASHEAARIYFDLRKSGITIRKPNDCLIAWYALEYRINLCHNNSDFELIKAGFEIKTI